jgi:hypothetical protein
MKTQTVTTNESDTTCVSELVQPLAEALQKLTQHPLDEIEVTPSTFEGQEARSNEAYLELDMHAETPDRLLRALWTILEQTGSWHRWLNFEGPDEHNRYDGPLMFALMQQHYGSGPFLYHSYLWCFSRDRDFDVEPAKRQVANLVALIGNSDNLVELELEHRMQL